MYNDRVKGTVRRIRGSLKEAAWKLMGKAKRRARGDLSQADATSCKAAEAPKITRTPASGLKY